MTRTIKILLLICFTASVITACGGADERKNAYLEKAKQSIAAGNLDKARIELKNVLQIDPKYSDAYFQLGKIYEQKKDYRQAFGNYSKAAELNPDNFADQAKLGRFYLLLAHDLTKAKEKRDLILKKEPQNIDGLLLKAGIDFFDKKPAEALAISQSIFKRDPAHVENASFLANLYLQKKQPEKAIDVLEKSLAKDKNNIQLTRLLAKVLVSNKKYSKAEKIYQNLLQKKPDDFISYTELAAFYNLTGDKQKAESTLRAAIENKSDSVDRQLTLATYIRAVKGNKAAEAELVALIKKSPAMGKLRISLGTLYVLDKNTDKARQVFKTAVKDFSDDVTGVTSRIALASLYMQAKQKDEALKELHDAIAIAPNNPKVNLLLAKIDISNKAYQNAVIALRVVVKEDPANVDAYFLLAATHQALGEKEQAKAVLNNAFENNRSNPKALMKLAKYYGSIKDMANTEKMVDSYLAIDNSNYEVRSMKAALLNKQKKFEQAKLVAIKLVKQFPANANGYIQSIPYLVHEKDNKKLVDLLKQGYAKVKNNRQILKLLTSIQINTGNSSDAINRVQAAIKKSPTDVDLKLLLAKIYLSTKANVKAEAKLKEIIQQQPATAEAYMLLADLYNKQGKKGKRLKVIQQGSQASNNIKLSITLATIYEAAGQYDNAVKTYESILEKHKNNLLAMNNLASVLSDHRQDKSSLKQAKALADKLKQTKQPVVQDTVGWVYYKAGDYKAAIESLKQAVKTAPNINIFNYHLGMAYKATGDKANAKVYLDKSLSNNKNFSAKDKAEAALKSL